MNIRLVGKYLGYLLWIEGGFMLPAVLVGLVYGELSPTLALLAGAACCGVAGLIFFLLCRSADAPFYAREGFVVAGGGWILISLFGALPFWLGGEIPSYIDAVFEVVSGFTTTGSSILVDVEAMSHTLLFWRSFTHWLGGVGVLAFLLAVVRSKRGGGSTIHLLRAESPGPQVGKTMPKMRESMQYLFVIYISLSLVNLVFLLAGGMPVFDALCTMFGTAGTGGFGIKADSLASYSPYLQNVTTIFMALFGVNFSLYFLLILREWKSFITDEELRLYACVLFGGIALLTLSLVFSGFGPVGTSLHHAAFAASTIMTTTGFATVDFNLWPAFSKGILMVLMIIGAMAGSTAGGFKVSRVLILLKNMQVGFHRLVHPRGVKAVRINKKTLPPEVIHNTYFFLSVYCLIIITAYLLISLDGYSVETNLSAVLACFNNIGPGLGEVGPMGNFSVFSARSKIVLTITMLLGRLEIFPILLLASPATWRRKT